MHQLTMIIEHDADRYYAYCPALEGCQTQGDSLEEAQHNMREAISLYLSTLTAQEKAALLRREVTAILMQVPVA